MREAAMFVVFLQVLAALMFGLGLFIDCCNLYFSISSIKGKRASPIVVVPFLFYLGSLIIAKLPVTFVQRILLMCICGVFHCICVFVLAAIIAKCMGINYFSAGSTMSEQALQGKIHSD